MNKSQLLAASLLAILFPQGAASADPQTGSGATDGYMLVWQDLFDGQELNPLRWDIEVNGAGGGNNELQYYTDRPQNVRLGDDGEGNGCLILTARRENYSGKNFTSGRVNSKNRIAFTHGKIEASIKLPKTADGLWPAFWMMGNDYDQVGWPKCGETDILEMGNSEGIKYGTQDRFFNGACHWGQGWPAASYAKSTTKAYSLQDGEFHLFTLVWDENSIAMYVDLDRQPVQNPYYKMDIPADDPTNEWLAGNYFHKDNFILFNLAVGGDFTGIHSASAISALNEANGNEASMYVNYVRIYQKGLTSENLDALDPGDSEQSSGTVDLMADGGDSRISFDGVTVISSHPDLEIYSLSGLKVAATSSGVLSVDSLSPGVYLAHNPLRTEKICIR
ncbi:MAG: glycoside hydrolase family 16 protein [Muribaculaceae bacterium]|nr:glycoside hydrolase family 16 protein [Muribaculaceae bacterium]